jgi:hypothetical protein
MEFLLEGFPCALCLAVLRTPYHNSMADRRPTAPTSIPISTQIGRGREHHEFLTECCEHRPGAANKAWRMQ